MTADDTSDRASEIEQLRLRLAEAEQTLDAIRAGEVDSLVVEARDGLRVYALETESNTYRVLIEAMNEGAAILTAEGIVLYCNSRFARLLDKPLQRVMGSSIHEHVADASRAALEAMLREAEERQSRGEIQLQDSHGGEVPAYLSVNAIQAGGRRVLCVVAVDLAEQKRNQEIVAAERLASSVLTQAAEAIIVCDDEGRIIRASAAAAELCGRNPLLLPFEEAFPIVSAEDNHPSMSAGEVLEDVLGGETFRALPARVASVDGRVADVLVSAGPLHGAQADVIGCVITMVDVTPQRRDQKALEESEARLRELDRRKNEFLAILSHELRNPLAPIVTALHILERVEAGDPQAKRAHEVIGRQVHQLARIVDDLLDVTRIARGKIELQRERVELGKLVASTVEDYRPFLRRSGMQLDVEIPPDKLYVHADPTRLAQVVGNLLHNAGKFAGPGESAKVEVEKSPDGERGIVRVTDTGPGIAPELSSRLFEPFAQADVSLDRSKGGLGLGLALVKGLVEMHGGRVGAKNAEQGKGAEMTIELPLIEAGEELAAAGSGPGAAIKRRILIIEDNVDAADSLRDLLLFDGHEVEVAYSGPEGLAKAREYRPDVVLCDLGLPGMDGYEVARAFRASESLRSTYLVAITGYAMQEDYVKARRAGFDGHMAKPPDHEELTEVLTNLPS